MRKSPQPVKILFCVVTLCVLAGAAVAGVKEFLNTAVYSVGDDPQGLTVGDFTNDRKVDIVVAGGSAMFLLPGNGDGTFGSAIVSGFLGDVVYSVAAADINGDGKLDVVMPLYLGGMASVLLGNGDGTFQPGLNFPAGGHTKSAVVGDFNGDGNLDLALSIGLSPGGVSILLGNGDGTFQGPVVYPTSAPTEQVAIGDLNGDGISDIAATTSGDAVNVLLGNGDGTFQPHSEYQVGRGPFAVAIADLNGDGNADIVTADTSKKVSVLLGNGDGTFQNRVNYDIGTQSFPFAIALVDFNGDGKIDIAVGSYNANVNVHFGMASVLWGNGDGTFGPHQDYSVGGNVIGLAAADFNRDGASDIAMPTFASNGLFVLLNTGGTRLATTSSANPSKVNDPVTFTTNIKPSRNGAAMPTGTITFYDGSSPLGTVALSNGQAALTTTSLTAGKHTIATDYSGDSSFNSNAAAPILQRVLP